MSKSAREVALSVLYQIEKKGAYSNLALNEARAGSTLSALDKAFVTELVLGVIKQKSYLDYQIQTASKIKLKKISPWILQILRMGIYQLHFMDKVPASAAVNESVKLAARYGNQGSKGFVNALLRHAETPVFPNSENRIPYLAVRYAYPEWLIEYWSREFSDDFLESLLEAGNAVPPVYVRKNTGKELTESDRLEPTEFSDVTHLLQGSVTDHPDFKTGALTVQDAASQMVGFSMMPEKHSRVLDLCAAPGGKTVHIAELLQNTGKVVACDIHPHKLALIENTASRMGVSNVEVCQNDALKENPEWREAFDYVLLDAPCSGLGIIRRKPDIKWNRTQEDITELAKMQGEMLEHAANYVKPGGTLIYSTCTITKEENREQTERFLKHHAEFRMTAFPDGFPIREESVSKGYLQLYPNRQNTDGFFICRMTKQAEERT